MFKLYSKTNKNVNMQIICKLLSWILMRLMSKSNGIIVPKGTKFAGLGKVGLKVVTQNRYNRLI